MYSPSQLKDLLSGRRRGLLAASLRSGLLLGELPYYLAVKWRNRRFDSGHGVQHVDRPVISVGNLTVGGTGKTPVVAWIASHLRSRSLRVTLLSRGYGARPDQVNDEALELEQLLPDVPHLQDRDRVKIARLAIEELEAEVLLLDDGFQHRRLGRDLDIVLIDATEPFGFGHLLPRGLLRESIAGLERADFVVISRADAVAPDKLDEISRQVRRYCDAPMAQVAHAPEDLLGAGSQRQPLGSPRIRRVAAFCGLGNPTGFRHTLAQAGFELVAFREFPDHHLYTRDDIDSLNQWLGTLSVDAALCTHKDLVKLQVDAIGDTPLWALTIGIQFRDGQSQLQAAIESAVGSDR